MQQFQKDFLEDFKAKFNTPLIGFDQLYAKLAAKMEGQPNYINNLTYDGMEHPDPDMSSFFYTQQYLSAVPILESFNSDCDTTLERFVKVRATDG